MTDDVSPGSDAAGFFYLIGSNLEKRTTEHYTGGQNLDRLLLRALLLTCHDEAI